MFDMPKVDGSDIKMGIGTFYGFLVLAQVLATKPTDRTLLPGYTFVLGFFADKK